MVQAAHRHCFRSRTPAETRALGRALAEAIADSGAGLVVGLCGDLGMGKTVFVKGLAEGLGIDPDLVCSPTFVIANQYQGEGGARLHHVDFYRLESEDELEAIGFFDLLDPAAVLAVEWADRFPGSLGHDRLDVGIEREETGGDEAGRRLDASAGGGQAAQVLAQWCRRASSAGLGADLAPRPEAPPTQ